MVKKIPKIFKYIKTRKKQKFIQTANGMNIDTTNTMMMVVDTDIDQKAFIEDLKKQFGDGFNVSLYVYEQIGAQAFLSPEAGSPKMGMSVLAESNYEDVRNHRINELLTGNKRKKRTIKRPSNRISKMEIKRASKNVTFDKKHVKKVYKFNRFTPDTCRKITNKLNSKSKAGNKYLITINKVYLDVQKDNISARGRISNKVKEINKTIRIKRNNCIKSVMHMKLDQVAAISRHKEVVRQSKRIDAANRVSGRILDAKNTIRLGFLNISNRSSGKYGLEQMKEDKRAFRLSNGLTVLTKEITREEKIKATGLIKEENENEIIQFVMNKNGIVEKQIVNKDGRIIKPVEEDKLVASDNLETVQRIITFEGKIVEQVVKANGEIDVDEYKVLDNADEESMLQVEELITNEELGLEEHATVEEKIEKMQTVIDNAKTRNLNELIEQTEEDEPVYERDIDYLIVEAMEVAKVDSIEELRKITSDDILDEKTQKKKDNFNRFLRETVEYRENKDTLNEEANLGHANDITAGEAEDLNEVKVELIDAKIEKIDNRIEQLTSNNDDVLFNVVAEMERARIAEELIYADLHGEKEEEKKSVDSKVESFGTLLKNLAKERMEETLKFPREFAIQTKDSMIEVFENAANETKTKDELRYERELRKAERRFANSNKQDYNQKLVNAVIRNESITKEKKIRAKGNESTESDSNKEEEITLIFYGAAVELGEQAVKLTNHYSIKDFYDKVRVVEGANLQKTQEKFLEIYDNLLRQMQLTPYSFAKNPVKQMDGWSICVIKDSLNNTQNNMQNAEEKEEVESISEDIRIIMDKYYKEINDIFEEIVKEYEVYKFNEIQNNSKANKDFVKKLRMELYRHNVENEQERAKSIIENLEKDFRFERSLKKIVMDRNAELLAKQAVIDAEERVSIVSEKEAEEIAKNYITPDEYSQRKSTDQSMLMQQVLSSVEKEQSREATVDPALNEILRKLGESGARVEIPVRGTNKKKVKRLRFETGGGTNL